MKAVILAGGLGTRLKPLTWFTPKPMIRVGGKPVIEHLIRHLRNFGINEIMIKVHYKYQQFMNYFGNSVLYYYEPMLLTEDETLAVLAPWMTEPTVVMNGDTLTNVNILKMYQLSKGQHIRYVDGDVYAGTRIIKPFFRYGKEYKYQDSEAFWIDTGTWAGLKRARRLYGSSR